MAFLCPEGQPSFRDGVVVEIPVVATPVRERLLQGPNANEARSDIGVAVATVGEL